MANRTATLALVLTMTALAGFPASALEAPRPVAPAPDGDDFIARVRGGCPSFHWAGVEGAKHYDLTVFEVRSDGEPVERYRIQVPGAAGSWAPGAERCLDPGSEYAWSLRALGADGTPGPWSNAVLFRVEAEPLPPAVARELAALRAAASGGSAGSDPGASEARKPGAGKQSTGEARSDAPAAALTPPGTSAAGPPTTIGIHGMVEAPGDGATGIFGSAAATSGATVGVRGEVASAAGTAGVFENLAGGPILVGRSGGAARFSVDGVGTVYADGHIIAAETFQGDGSGLENVNADTLDHVAAADYALESEVMGIVLNADGNASGLDADFLDGNDSSSFALDTEVMPIVLANDGAGSGLDAELFDGRPVDDFSREFDDSGDRRYFSDLNGTAFGRGAMNSIAPGDSGGANVAFGDFALPNITPGAGAQGTWNTAIGIRTLFSVSTANTNTAIGYDAGSSLLDGNSNVAVGAWALDEVIGGNANIAVGLRAGGDLTGNESHNILIGSQGIQGRSGEIRIGGDGGIIPTSSNLAIGHFALGAIDTGNRNIAVGTKALENVGSGNNNIAIGYQAGDDLGGIESDNILIGNSGNAFENGAIRIGSHGTHTVASIAGDLGIGTADPLNRFHAMAGIDGPGTPGNHVALIENWQIGGPDVLALKVGEPGHLEGDTNFITFFNGDDESKGAIQGNGASGVALVGPGNDFAEWLEKRDPAEKLAPGQVVGVFAGQVSLETDGADRVMVVSTDPIVVGNDPGEDERPGWARIALIGQAQVRVRGPARPGDLLVASGAGDGRAVAVSPQDVTIDQLHLAIGRVVHGPESVRNGEARVRAFVGLPDALSQRTLGSMVRAIAERMARQESELREIRAELQTMVTKRRRSVGKARKRPEGAPRQSNALGLVGAAKGACRVPLGATGF